VLVDGAVMKNFPARHHARRPTWARSSASRRDTVAHAITARTCARPLVGLRWIWSGQWRLGPADRLALDAHGHGLHRPSTWRGAARPRRADQPDVSGIEIRDWGAYDQAVEAGYRATLEMLEQVQPPDPAAARRLSLAEQARSGAA
jgi:NTE family protein